MLKPLKQVPLLQYLSQRIFFGYSWNFVYLLFNASWMRVSRFKIIDHPESEKIIVRKIFLHKILYATWKLDYIFDSTK